MISMKSIGQMSRLTCSLIFVLVSSALAGSSAASAQTLTTLTSLTDGKFPWGNLVVDANGNLFGTTEQGGALGDGTIFEIAKTSSGYASTPTTLVSFNGNDGAWPLAGLIVDANGNLFGTAQSGGEYGYGTVFEIANAGGVYASTPTTLVSFTGNDGAVPEAGLIADANGNLFGATAVGGAYYDGTVFEIVKTSSGYANTPTTLASFNGNDGEVPQARLTADANGNLFGTTNAGGGVYGDGTVFEIAKTSSGYASTPTTLVSFNGNDGADPQAGLIVDANGNLFGATYLGGAYGYGTVFEIANSGGVYASTPTTLVSFNVNDGSPTGLIADANGNLFGTTSQGGVGDGTIFEVVKTSSGYANTPTTLVSFNGSDGAGPEAGLIADVNGDLFGTTSGGGSNNTGTVFEIFGSGFVISGSGSVPPKQSNQFAGTPGSADCTGKSTSSLAHTYGGIAHAAPALGYASVSALQSAIANYCRN